MDFEPFLDLIVRTDYNPLIMIKIYFITATIIVFSNFGFSKELKESLPNYEIISNEFDSNIPKNKYVIEGKIVDKNTQVILENIEIFYLENEKSKVVSKNGFFKLTLNLDRQQLLFRTTDLHRVDIHGLNAKSQYRMNVIIYIDREEERFIKMTEKPVVYAYSPLDLDLLIHLKPSGKLKFTYPQITESNSWEMKLKNNHFLDQKGNKYPYLFWDSEQKDIHISKSENNLFGAILANENVVSYLDSILSKVGFNSQEKTDFITYWGPRLVQTEFCFIQFQTQQECSQFADYEIAPKPDNFNRFYILFSGFEYFPTNFSVTSQKLTPFNRDGFNLLEWGGVEVNNETLNQNL